MNEIILKIIPVILIFFLGYFLKILKLANKDNADFLLKLNFYITLPALIIISIKNINLNYSFIFLPLIAILIILITYGISFLFAKLYKFKKETFGTFLISTMIMNIGFVLPFFIAVYGNEGLAIATLFDFGNGLLTFTLTYFLACKYGGNKNNSKLMMKKIFYSPPLLALIIGLFLNFGNLSIPLVVNDFLNTLGLMTIPLIMLSLGIYFSPKFFNFFQISTVIFIRMFLGFILGILFVSLFDLDGLSRVIVLISAAVPVGYNTLTFSSIENLDKEFAANIVSYSILVGILIIPILIYFL